MSTNTASPARRVTAAQLLASIEAIPETPENYRALRDAIRDARALVAGELA
ncbi:hypothetical protein [Arthrobacter sp. ISL-69]|uniref:hypothetical protein n=1 Tax=Arthrobacter sp. ISL-69 TaxID=2819113 RepID=UPI001BEC1A34|nr:hypothetical protein [Arthrobacter sp. ISL-69]MBT2537235.1 hypothetical protein [Arthrobacter sp. ISL-69]